MDMMSYQNRVGDELAPYSPWRNLKNGRRKGEQVGPNRNGGSSIANKSGRKIEVASRYPIVIAPYPALLQDTEYIDAQTISWRDRLWLLTSLVAKRDGRG